MQQAIQPAFFHSSLPFPSLVPLSSGESFSQCQYIMPPSMGHHYIPGKARREEAQCSVPECPQLVASTIWCHHMDSHLRGVLPGAVHVHDAWLMEESLSVLNQFQLPTFIPISTSVLQLYPSQCHLHHMSCQTCSLLISPPQMRCVASGARLTICFVQSKASLCTDVHSCSLLYVKTQ